MKGPFILGALCTLAISLSLVQGCSPGEYAVIPQPQLIVYRDGYCSVGAGPDIVYLEALSNEAGLLKQFLTEDFSMRPVLRQGTSGGTIRLILDQEVLPDHPEGYILDIADNITISANTPAGILHGVQTLRQVIRREDGQYLAARGTITDYPHYSWRAFMLDECRYFKGKEVVFGLLDEMSLLKMNTFHWHLTDDQGWRIEIKKYPLLTEVGAFRDSTEIGRFHSNVFDGKPHGGFYTQQEIREVVAYAAARHINIVPEIEMPGHASAAIAAYPWLGTEGTPMRVPGWFGVHYTVFNVADPRVVGFLEDVLDEVITLFPGPVIHIGGDEIRYDQWKESESVRDYMRVNGISTPAELQVFFTNGISEFLARKGRRMIGWNDITGQHLHHYQSAEDNAVDRKLSPGTIVQFCHGDPKLITESIVNGYDVVNSHHVYTYLDYTYESIPLKKAYGFRPTPDGLTEEQAGQVLGLGCQMWCEFVPTVEIMNRMVFPRLAAYAETGWTAPGRKDYSRFLRSLPSITRRWDSKGIVYGPVE